MLEKQIFLLTNFGSLMKDFVLKKKKSFITSFFIEKVRWVQDETKGFAGQKVYVPREEVNVQFVLIVSCKTELMIKSCWFP